MRTEDDLRAALAELECHAPDALAVLATVCAKTGPRRIIVRRHLTWSLAAATTAAAVSAAAVISAGAFDRVTRNGPPARAPSAAAALRQLAARAATQPAPALGPVLYTSDTLWAPDVPGQRHGLLAQAGVIDLQRDWASAAARYSTVTDQGGKHSRASSYAKFDPRSNPDWRWRDPATLPASPAALRRHLLSKPESKPVGGAVSGPPLTPDQKVFRNAFELMGSEPLRPAVRASMLGLIADIVQRSSPRFVVLGTVTDRAGHRDIAIASETNEIWAFSAVSSKLKYVMVHNDATELLIYFFDPATGGLRAFELATCTGPVSTLRMASARCAPANYEQYLVIKAVRSLPRGASASSTSPLDHSGLPWWIVIP